jgi:hypothetical protein
MEPFGATIFCDDIRDELHGKTSLIGVYGTELVSYDEFPLSLPKMGFYITVCFPVGGPLISDVKLHVYLPQDKKGQPSYSSSLGWQTTAEDSSLPDPKVFPDPLGVIQFTTYVLLGPINIQKSGFFRVRLTHQDQEIKIGALEAVYREQNKKQQT